MTLPFLIACAVLCTGINNRSGIPISMETLPQVIKKAFDTVERNGILSNENMESSSFCFDFDIGGDFGDDFGGDFGDDFGDDCGVGLGSSNCDAHGGDRSSDVHRESKEDETTDEDESSGSCSSSDTDASQCSTIPLARDSLCAHGDCNAPCDSLLHSSHEGIIILFVLLHR